MGAVVDFALLSKRRASKKEYPTFPDELDRLTPVITTKYFFGRMTHYQYAVEKQRSADFLSLFFFADFDW